VAARRIVVALELGQLPLQIDAIPKQYMIEEFSTDCPDQTLHEGV